MKFTVETEMTGMLQGNVLDEFRKNWAEFTEQENNYLSGAPAQISTAQMLLIGLFTAGDLPEKASNIYPPQMELEAIFRGRSRALASAFQKGQLT